MLAIDVKGQDHEVDVEPDTPRLWGSDGCGIAQCVACTVHVDGEARRACSTPVKAARDERVTTREALKSKTAKAVQSAWVELDVVHVNMAGASQPGLNRRPCFADYQKLAYKPGGGSVRRAETARELAHAAKTIDAVYELPFLALATMAPLSCVVCIDDMPRVEVHAVPSKARPTGVGEPDVPPHALAAANAGYPWTGQREPRMRFSRHKHGVKRA